MQVYKLSLVEEQKLRSLTFEEIEYLTGAVVVACSEQFARTICATKAQEADKQLHEYRMFADTQEATLFGSLWLDNTQTSCTKIGVAEKNQTIGLVLATFGSTKTVW